jgi:hypothetical protein
MPDPVEWEPCPSPGPLVASCKRMKTPWTKTTALSQSPSTRCSGSINKAAVRCSSSRRTNLDDDKSSKRRLRLVADLDGPVLNALFESSYWLHACLSSSVRATGGSPFAVAPYDIPTPGEVEGVVAGKIGDPMPEHCAHVPGRGPVRTVARVFGVADPLARRPHRPPLGLRSGRPDPESPRSIRRASSPYGSAGQSARPCSGRSVV